MINTRVILCNVAEEDAKDSHSTSKSLKDESPFTSYFGGCVDETLTASKEGCDNVSYCVEGFESIKDIMHLYPLWAGALHRDVDRFSCDSPSDLSAYTVTRPRSNAKVESFFGDLKTHCLSSMRQRPADFIREELLNVKGRINARKLPDVRSRRKTEVASEPEKWKRRGKSLKRKSKYLRQQVQSAPTKKIDICSPTYDVMSTKVSNT